MNFKFDKEGSEIDLSMGSDDGVVLPKKPPVNRPAMPSQRNNEAPVANKQPIRTTQPSSNPPQQRQAAPTRTPQPERRPIQQPAPARRPAPTIPETRSKPVSVPVVSEQEQPNYRAPEATRPIARPVEQPVYQEEPRRSEPAHTFDYSYTPSAEETQWESNPRSTIDNRFQQSAPTPAPQQAYDEPFAYPAPVAPEPEVNKKAKLGLFEKKPKAEKVVPEKKISSLRGGRKGVVIGKVAISGILVILCFVGAKSIFFPTQFPSPAQIIAVVKDDLNVTAFPVDKANSFVINFTKAYLTITPTQENTARDNLLRQFASEGVLNSMKMSIINGDGTGVQQQTVTSEPIITGVNSVDDTNAIFTVQTQVSSGSTLLLSIPVYYDEKINSFAISAPASILPATGLAKVPNTNHEITWTNDSDVVKVLSPDLENYLKAWGASDTDIIKRYISPNATLTAKTGLGGSVVFSKVTDLTVEFKAEDSGENLAEREAKFSVEWADAKTPNVIYTQTYKLDIFEQPDKRWYIKDISSVITEPEN
jgi:hypothetical protein